MSSKPMNTQRREVLIDNDRMRVVYLRRNRNDLMGRFGGGWQWNLGVQASGGCRTVIVNLLIASVRIERKP